LDDDDHVREGDEATIAGEEAGARGGFIVGYERRITASSFQHAREQPRVLFRVCAREASRRDHDRLPAHRQCAAVRRAVDASSSSGKDGDSRLGQLGRQVLREALAFGGR
jgi:hypothetical protein